MVDPTGRYATTAALRTALEQRLRQRSLSTGVPLDRLRKEVAHQRLLGRLATVAPEGSWALKGGQALLARLDQTARATKDADTTWRDSQDSFSETIDRAAATDLHDGFRFEIGPPLPLQAETGEGGLRYPVLALLDHREFERLQLDANLAHGDLRPIELLSLRNLLDFAGIGPPIVPVIPIGQHLAEKLHAYTRIYSSGPSSRHRDLYDMLVIAHSLPLPTVDQLHQACHATFVLSDTDWPAALPPPPATWTTPWVAYVTDHDIPWTTLDQAAALSHLGSPCSPTPRPTCGGAPMPGDGSDKAYCPPSARWFCAARSARSDRPGRTPVGIL